MRDVQLGCDVDVSAVDAAIDDGNAGSRTARARVPGGWSGHRVGHPLRETVGFTCTKRRTGLDRDLATRARIRLVRFDNMFRLHPLHHWIGFDAVDTLDRDG